jgi:hypothetical protein
MNTIPNTASLTRSLVALAAAGASLAAQAVPVTVSIGGLPSGLAPVLTVSRNVCTDGLSWLNNPSQPLTEQNLTVLDRIVLPSGLLTFRPRVITRYVASFDTQATPDPAGPTPQLRCSVTGMDTDRFLFGVRVPGLNAGNRPSTLGGFVAETPQAGPVKVNATLAARTTSFLPAVDALARGMVHSFNVRYESSLGAVQSQAVDFLRPASFFPGSFLRAARIFVRADGVGCVQAGSTTRCLGEPTLPEAGGVLLRGVQRNILGQPGVVRFQFELMHSFPTGSLKLNAVADALDLPAYQVDGVPQALNLLPWQGMTQTVTVQ